MDKCYEIRSEHWEADERIITLDGAPIGRTLSERQAEFVADWLRAAIGDIRRVVRRAEGLPD